MNWMLKNHEEKYIADIVYVFVSKKPLAFEDTKKSKKWEGEEAIALSHFSRRERMTSNVITSKNMIKFTSTNLTLNENNG